MKVWGGVGWDGMDSSRLPYGPSRFSPVRKAVGSNREAVMWALPPPRIEIFGGPSRGQGQVGVGVGKGKNELVSDTNSFLSGGRVPRPFWLKVHTVTR